MVAPHTFCKWPVCMLSNWCFIHMIGTWHFIVFCKCMVCILSNQCFIYQNGSWCYTTFYKWTDCMLSNWCFIHSIGNGYDTTVHKMLLICLRGVIQQWWWSCMLQQYAQEWVGMWDWSPHVHWSEDLVNPFFMTLDVTFSWLKEFRMGMDESNTHYIFRTRWQKYHQQKAQFLWLLFQQLWHSLWFCKCHGLYIDYQQWRFSVDCRLWHIGR
jgi:hypothetical protein